MQQPAPLNIADMPGGPKAGTLIVQLDDLPAHGGKDIVFIEDKHRINIFVQQYNGEVYVFQNRCPHAGTPLNMFNDRFLNLEGNAFICRTHGALFEVSSGRCIAGPCKRQYLRPVQFEVRNGAIYTV